MSGSPLSSSPPAPPSRPWAGRNRWNPMHRPPQRFLLVLLLAYGAASLVHFTHNAEFLRDYPGLPLSWTRGDIYLAWLGMTAVGALGWWLLRRGRTIAGPLVLVLYALIGLDS